MKNNCFKKAFCALKNKEYNFVKHFKYFFLGSILFVLMATIVFALFGFNGNYDFSGGYMVRMTFGTDIGTEALNEHEQTISNIMQDNDISNYTVYTEGEAEDLAITIKFTTPTLTTAEQTTLFEQLVTDITNQVNASNHLGFNITDVQSFEPSVLSKTIWFAVLAYVVMLVLIFVYNVIRFDWVVALSVVGGAVFDVLLLLSLLIVTRIEISTLLFTVLAITIVLSAVRSNIKFAKIREGFLKEQNNNKTNMQIVSETLKDSFVLDAITLLSIVAVALLMIIIYQPLALQLSAMLVFMALVQDYTTYAIIPSIWALIYNRKNDRRLQKRLEDKNKTATELENEKLVI